jgi:hypothetical protein
MGLRLLLGVAGVAAITTGLIRRHRKNLELANADGPDTTARIGDDMTADETAVDAAPIPKARTRPILTPDVAATPIN